MKKLFALALSLALSGCRSLPQTGVLAPSCAQTPVRESDLRVFGFKMRPGQIVVMRILGTWCPFCKADLARMGSLFTSHKWSPDSVQVFLLAYRGHGESQDTVAAFQRENLKSFGLPEDAVQIVFVDKDYHLLKEARGASGDLLFAGWQGIPFGLVFGKDGRLAYRGQFTANPGGEDKHYEFITDLQKETCRAPDDSAR